MKLSKRAKTLIAVSAASLLPAVLIAAPAQAREIERTGTCTMNSVFTAEIEREYNVWDLSFEVDTLKAGDTWRLIVNQNGKRVANQKAKAIQNWDDSYAELDWDLIRPNRPGADRFFMSAKNLTTGEICRVTLRG